MKNYLVLFSIIFVIGCGDSKKENIDLEKYEEELSAYSASFMGGLKSVLLSNMKEGGPLQAVSVCSDTAEALTDFFANENNIYIKRVSFNNRNPKNTPDKYEKEVINNFQELAESGNLSNANSVVKLITKDDKEFVHFMKPLFVEAPCLNCHGTEDQISSDVKEHIQEKYPADKAIGYKIGDLRGAISIKKEI